MPFILNIHTWALTIKHLLRAFTLFLP